MQKEKEILRKIYLLRKIDCSKEWKEQTREEILGQFQEEKPSVLFSPFKPAMPMVGAFAFSVLLMLLILPSLSLFPEIEPLPLERVALEEEGEEQVALFEETGPREAEEVRVSVDSQDVLLSQRTDDLEHTLREVQRTVLGMMVKSEKTIEPETRLTDKQIAAYLLEEMEGSFTLQVLDEDSKAKRARDAFEEEDYTKVFDIYLE